MTVADTGEPIFSFSHSDQPGKPVFSLELYQSTPERELILEDAYHKLRATIPQEPN